MSHIRSVAAAGALCATAALCAPAAAQDAPPPITPDRQVAFEHVVELAPDSTRTYRMPIDALGQDANVLLPCWGLSIKGSGVDLAAGGLGYFGLTEPEPGAEGRPDGGVPGAERQPDGTFVVPESNARITSEMLRRGENCRAVGWRFYDDAGRPTLDPYGNPLTASGKARSAKASRSLRAKQRRRAARKVRGRAAQSGPVRIELAGITRSRGRSADMVVRVRTGALQGPVRLSMHARVLRQAAVGR